MQRGPTLFHMILNLKSLQRQWHSLAGVFRGLFKEYTRMLLMKRAALNTSLKFHLYFTGGWAVLVFDLPARWPLRMAKGDQAFFQPSDGYRARNHGPFQKACPWLNVITELHSVKRVRQHFSTISYCEENPNKNPTPRKNSNPQIWKRNDTTTHLRRRRRTVEACGGRACGGGLASGGE